MRERHGTTAGAARHVRQNEPPCDACRAAKGDYDARRRRVPDVQLRNRQHARAQSDAYRALAKMHADEYRALYVEAKARIINGGDPA